MIEWICGCGLTHHLRPTTKAYKCGFCGQDWLRGAPVEPPAPPADSAVPTTAPAVPQGTDKPYVAEARTGGIGTDKAQ